MKKLFLLLGVCIVYTDLAAQVTLFSNTPDKADSIGMLSITSDVHFSSSPSDDSEGTSSGTGSLGIKFRKKYFYGSTQISVFSRTAGTSGTDSLSNNSFGNNLLIPQNGGQGFSSFYTGMGFRRINWLEYDDDEYIDSNFWQHNSRNVLERLGIFGYFSTNKMDWQNDSLSIPVVINAAGVYLTAEILNWELLSDNDVNGDNLSFSLLAGYSARRIGGDLGLDKNKDIRKTFLSTEARAFDGWEIGGLLEIGDFYGRMSLTGFPTGNIEGFSGNQLLITLGLNADLNIMARERD